MRPRGLTLLPLGPDDLEAAKELDDLAFGGHQGVSLAALRAIAEHGVVLGLLDQSGLLLAAAQVILRPIAEPEERLARELDGGTAYLEGFAVRPNCQNAGLGRLVLAAVDEAVRQTGKAWILATVRPENGASVRLLTKNGYRVEGYDDHYYPGADAGAAGRLIVRKSLCRERHAAPRDLPDEKVRVCDSAAELVAAANDARIGIVGIPTPSTGRADLEVRSLIAAALAAGFVGTRLDRPSMWSPRDGDDRNLLIFNRRGSDRT